MPEDESALSSFDKTLNWWAELYSEQPLIRALFALASALPLPIGAGLAAVGKELMDAGVEEMLRERSRAFFDELAIGERYLTKELIQQEDFLHAFFATRQAAMRCRNREKIRRFARLLLTGIKENRLDDTLEEFISILNDLSTRELEILRILKSFEDSYPHRMMNSNEPLKWKTMQQELGVFGPILK
jgi:hypothetical protein